MPPTPNLETAKSVCQVFLTWVLWCLSVFYSPDMDENLYYKMLNSKTPKSKFFFFEHLGLFEYLELQSLYVFSD